jgi:hypothetical protein
MESGITRAMDGIRPEEDLARMVKSSGEPVDALLSGTGAGGSPR